jgi:hypothetical protein
MRGARLLWPCSPDRSWLHYKGATVCLAVRARRSWRTARRSVPARRVRRLELICARLRHPRSEGCRSSDLRFRLTFGDRSCPLLSAVHPSAADPARTEERFRPRRVADAFGAPVLRDQGSTGRPGTARPIIALEHRELGKHCRAARQRAVAQLSASGDRPLLTVGDRRGPLLRPKFPPCGVW